MEAHTTLPEFPLKPEGLLSFIASTAFERAWKAAD